MSQAVSGADGKVSVASGSLNVSGYTCEFETVIIDTTTTGDTGWEDAIDGVSKASGTFNFFWDSGKNPFSVAQGLMPGAIHLGINSIPTLTFNLESGHTFGGPALITKLSLKSAVREAKEFTASFTSKGPWTLPT